MTARPVDPVNGAGNEFMPRTFRPDRRAHPAATSTLTAMEHLAGEPSGHTKAVLRALRLGRLEPDDRARAEQLASRWGIA